MEYALKYHLVQTKNENYRLILIIKEHLAEAERAHEGKVGVVALRGEADTIHRVLVLLPERLEQVHADRLGL